MDRAERRHEAMMYYIDVSHEDLFSVDSTTLCLTIMVELLAIISSITFAWNASKVIAGIDDLPALQHLVDVFEGFLSVLNVVHRYKQDQL